MNQPAYLWKNSDGVYYFRARIPKQFLRHFTCGEIKKSLKTDSYRLAVNLERAYRVKLDEEMAKLEKGKFTVYQAVITGKALAILPDGEKVPVMAKSEWNLSEKQARQYFSRKLKWDPSDFSGEKFAGDYCLRLPAFVLCPPRRATPLRYAAHHWLPQMT
ncbi:MAG: hypothetical protein PHR16_02585 [Methylovulum sp.]|nr:hypothetical protein [Methylovulum sp.]